MRFSLTSTRRRTPHCVQQPRQLDGLTVCPGWALSTPETGSMRNSGVSELPRTACAGRAGRALRQALTALTTVSP